MDEPRYAVAGDGRIERAWPVDGWMTEPRAGECLACYVWRMLENGCRGLRWAVRFRETTAPRATALEGRLGRMGAYCDCEIFFNAYEADPLYFHTDEFGEVVEQATPVCMTVRPGSTKPCPLWRRVPRW
jgi:hypothetical protein